jgi:hypothetical protein
LTGMWCYSPGQGGWEAEAPVAGGKAGGGRGIGYWGRADGGGDAGHWGREGGGEGLGRRGEERRIPPWP